MKAKLFLFVCILMLDLVTKELKAQNITSKNHYSKWEVGLNGGYFFKPKVSIEPYGRINPNFLLLAKRNIKNGNNALRFSADVNYEKSKFIQGIGLGMPYTGSLAFLAGYEKRFVSKNRLRPFVGVQQSVRMNINQALAEEFTSYPANQEPLNYSYKNQKDYIFIFDFFTGLEYKIYQNIYASAEIALKVEHFSSNTGGYGFGWLLEDGNSTSVNNSGGYLPSKSRISLTPFTFLNLNYKFK